MDIEMTLIIATQQGDGSDGASATAPGHALHFKCVRRHFPLSLCFIFVINMCVSFFSTKIADHMSDITLSLRWQDIDT